MKVIALLYIVLLPIINNTKADNSCIVQDYLNIPEAIQKCNVVVLDNLDIPGGETLRLPLKDGQTLYFRGTTRFGYDEWEGPLVVINGTNVTIEGETNAILDGQGQMYWDGQGEWGSLKPEFFVIQLHNSVMRNINVVNSPVHCVLLTDSSDVVLSDWIIDNLDGDPVAGLDFAGHNTDGFDIWNGTNIVIKNSLITNQDDCVAIRYGSNILINDLFCNGSHGISLSVGFSSEFSEQNIVRDVVVNNTVLKGGNNGIHIKTHVDGCEGLIENVTYSNIIFDGPVNYGIIIQQNYRNLPENATFPSAPSNNIPIRTLFLKNIEGNVEDSAVPIYILCADEGCFDWTFTNVSVNGIQNNYCNYEPDSFHC